VLFEVNNASFGRDTFARNLQRTHGFSYSAVNYFLLGYRINKRIVNPMDRFEVFFFINY